MGVGAGSVSHSMHRSIVFQSSGKMAIEIADVEVHVGGDMALVTCTEYAGRCDGESKLCLFEGLISA